MVCWPGGLVVWWSRGLVVWWSSNDCFSCGGLVVAGKRRVAEKLRIAKDFMSQNFISQKLSIAKQYITKTWHRFTNNFGLDPWESFLIHDFQRLSFH